MPDRLSPAGFAARRQLLGLSYDELSGRLGVRPDTCQRWVSGREPVPLRVTDELSMLIREQGDLAQRMLDADADAPVVVVRGDGWALGAAARAVAVEPDLMLEWAPGRACPGTTKRPPPQQG